MFLYYFLANLTDLLMAILQTTLVPIIVSIFIPIMIAFVISEVMGKDECCTYPQEDKDK